MKLIEKIKEHFNSKNQNIGNTNIIYEQIYDAFKDYDSYLPEVKNLENHEHYKKVETEDLILKLINQDESVLFIKDEEGIGVVEVILILVVLIGLVLIFKKQIYYLRPKSFYIHSSLGSKMLYAS